MKSPLKGLIDLTGYAPVHFAALVLLVVFATACDSGDAQNDDEDPPYTYSMPQRLGDGLEPADADAEGLNVALLEAMLQRLQLGDYANMHSVLVARHGKLVLEAYFPGTPIYGAFTNWGPTTLHNLHSVTKSFTSALVGLATQKADFDLDTPLLSFFPEYADIPLGQGKDRITVRHALSMASGLAWDEWSFSYDDERNDHAAMYNSGSGNWIRYVLERPMATEPGTAFVYNSGLSIALGGLVFNATGEPVERFANTHLFGPLGISRYTWHADLGIYQTGGGLSLTPRDMMKFGLLYLNDGQWKGQQILDADWVRESTRQQGPRSDYAYHWWLTSYPVQGQNIEAFYAGGRGGQYIIVLRELDMVVVFTAGNDNDLAWRQPRDMMLNYILPAAL